MSKKLIFTIILLLGLLKVPSFVLAEDQICVTQYGGGTVCGAKTPEYHAPVKAGLADFDLPLLGVCFIGVSGYFYWKSKKANI